MLKKFTVENYKNFEKPITLDFTVKHNFSFNETYIKNNLLEKIVIYGENSSGKTNLGYALFDIVGLLTDKQTQPEEEEAFINADTGAKEAIFTYEFQNDNDIIVYMYKKTAPRSLSFESLTINDVEIYKNEFKNKWEINFNHKERIGTENLNFEYFSGDLAALRYIANNTNQKEDSPVKFIMNFVSHMLWFRSLKNNGYIGFMKGSESIDSWMVKNKLVKDFQKFLKDFAKIDKKIEASKQIDNMPLLIEKHKNAEFLFNQVASSGTHALKLFYYWSKRFPEVSLLYMDEFDAYYHFDLARKILQYVNGFENLQAVLTTHDPYLASNDILRPDAYFMLKDGRLKSFPDSTTRELRPGYSLDKLLRNGEFDG